MAATIGRKNRNAMPAVSCTMNWRAEARMLQTVAAAARYQVGTELCRNDGVKSSKVSAKSRQAARFINENLRPQISTSITHMAVKPTQEAIIIVFLKGSVVFFIV
jgi:hypothetical protein